MQFFFLYYEDVHVSVNFSVGLPSAMGASPLRPPCVFSSRDKNNKKNIYVKSYTDTPIYK